MTALAVLVGIYAFGVLLLPQMRPPFIRERLGTIPLAVYAHLGGGAVAMILGPFQFSTRLRTRYLTIHRWMGRTYVASVAAAGIGGLVMATVSQYGIATHVGFGMLAVLWLVTTGLAFRFAKAGDSVTHRRWMIRSFALTFAAVMLRIWIPLGLASGMPIEPVYVTVAWFSWVPNLIVAEWIILRQPVQPRRTLSRSAIVA